MANLISADSAQTFTATLSTNLANITGSGTTATLIWDTVPAGFGYDTTTGVMTALMTATYIITPLIRLTGLTTANTLGVGTAVATGKSLEFYRKKIGVYASATDNAVTITPSIPLILQKNDTVYFTIQVSGGVSDAVSLDAVSQLKVMMVL